MIRFTENTILEQKNNKQNLQIHIRMKQPKLHTFPFESSTNELKCL